MQNNPYEYRHVVSFEETNLLGNVYFTHYLRWQGLCRERFLKEYTPQLLGEFSRGLTLVTTHVSCNYLRQLKALDEVAIRMRLMDLSQSEITLGFEYLLHEDGTWHLAARGEQKVACMQLKGDKLVPTRLPASLLEALTRYR